MMTFLSDYGGTTVIYDVGPLKLSSL